ncbi:phosphatase [Aliidiomarina iranensis]|uniref:Phosphatase n=1 Tax=Aliidiomarina iranensis TaxID=1434071 RepID=A0A432VSR0_9GAMM|nr:PHP domain-containing protein [Aliidiomarina iranensis]RUO19282.1 phosphatase [Aliidiomarina iranensis]
MQIDLHCHTTASDGALTPAEMVMRAGVMQIDVLAITDHDSVSGFYAAKKAREEQRLARLQLIPGVEFSTLWEGFEIHILGWQFDLEHPAIVRLLAEQRERRHQRSEAIHAKLVKQGVAADVLPTPRPDSRPELNSESTAKVVTRLHYAEALFAHGYCNSVQNAFEKYLGKGQCAYEKPQWCLMSEAVAVINAAGGVASIAHPLAYDLSNKWLRRLITEFKDDGGQALEVISSQQNPEQRRWLTELALEYELLASAGSDFHYPGRYRELGRNLTMPNELTPVWHDWPLQIRGM